MAKQLKMSKMQELVKTDYPFLKAFERIGTVLDVVLSLLEIVGLYTDNEEKIALLRKEIAEFENMSGDKSIKDIEGQLAVRKGALMKSQQGLEKQGKFVMPGLGSGIMAALGQPTEEDRLELRKEELRIKVGEYNLEKDRFELAKVNFMLGEESLEGLLDAYDYMIKITENEKEKKQLMLELKNLTEQEEQGLARDMRERESIALGPNGKAGTSIKPIAFQPNLGSGKPYRVAGGGTVMEDVAKSVDLTFTEIMQVSGVFQQSFASGMQGVGQSINQSVGGMFRGVFGEANSLLEIFISNFVSSMAGNVLSLLTGGASSGILGILGFAKGGVIEAGPELC